MKFGASSFIWVSPFSNKTLDQFKKAKAMGFDIYEVCVEQTEVIDAAAIARAAKEAGIEVTICGAFGPTRDISSEDPAIRAEGVEYIKFMTDLAVQLGSPFVAGPMYSAVGKARMTTPQEKADQTKWAVENMKVVAEYAAKKNIKLAVEPLNRFETDFINTVDQGNEFLDQIGMDNVGFLIDTFHANIEEPSIPNAVRKAGKRLISFHSCANDRGTPGEDHIDWKGIKKAFDEIKYNGPVIIESFTRDIVEIAKAVSLWRPLAESQDILAQKGIKFLKTVF